MDTETDLTWRLPLLRRRWAYVAPRRCKRLPVMVPWWAVMLLCGPVAVALGLLLALATIWMQGL